MISSSALHVGRHGSTHSLQQIHLSAARNLQHQPPSSPDSPQLSARRHHDTITEGDECEDEKIKEAVEEVLKKTIEPKQQSPAVPKTKKGSITSHKDRR